MEQVEVFVIQLDLVDRQNLQNFDQILLRQTRIIAIYIKILCIMFINVNNNNNNDGQLLVYESFAAEILGQAFCSETEICLIFLISTGQKTDPTRPNPTGNRRWPTRPITITATDVGATPTILVDA